MAKTRSLGVRLKPEVKMALERVAEEDMRSLSSLIEKILTTWLREHGQLNAEARLAGAGGPIAAAPERSPSPSSKRKGHSSSRG